MEPKRAEPKQSRAYGARIILKWKHLLWFIAFSTDIYVQLIQFKCTPNGKHDDYFLTALLARIAQAQHSWLCACVRYAFILENRTKHFTRNLAYIKSILVRFKLQLCWNYSLMAFQYLRQCDTPTFPICDEILTAFQPHCVCTFFSFIHECRSDHEIRNFNVNDISHGSPVEKSTSKWIHWKWKIYADNEKIIILSIWRGKSRWRPKKRDNFDTFESHRWTRASLSVEFISHSNLIKKDILHTRQRNGNNTPTMKLVTRILSRLIMSNVCAVFMHGNKYGNLFVWPFRNR